MECHAARERLCQAKQLLAKINENYENTDQNAELYTQSYLVVCRSVVEYVIADYLSSISPKLSITQKSEIIRLRNRNGSENKIKTLIPNHSELNKILQFLQNFRHTYTLWEKDPLVRYFTTVRNLLVHSVFFNIFLSQQENGKIVHRYLERDFNDYLLLNSGDKILLNSGFPLQLNGQTDSLFGIYPLSNTEPLELQRLGNMLENTEASELLVRYVKIMTKFVEHFESYY